VVPPLCLKASPNIACKTSNHEIRNSNLGGYEEGIMRLWINILFTVLFLSMFSFGCGGGDNGTPSPGLGGENPSDPITQLLNSMVYIPSGSFQMGSKEDLWVQPVHTVTLSGFYMGEAEVTQAQYTAVMDTNPSFYNETRRPNADNNPVESVTWTEAKDFCQRLSAMTSRTFTLPSEAQWEYACRAGSTTLYSFGDSDSLLGDYAWWGGNTGTFNGYAYGPHPVKTKLPNPWGLYDMHGNVMEWCLDAIPREVVSTEYPGYYNAPTDGSAFEPGEGNPLDYRYLYRACRGGKWEWNGDKLNFTSFYRYFEQRDYRDYTYGFRVIEVR
jgi:eukaryotic-like serine/threonine-protein kinase